MEPRAERLEAVPPGDRDWSHAARHMESREETIDDRADFARRSSELALVVRAPAERFACGSERARVAHADREALEDMAAGHRHWCRVADRKEFHITVARWGGA